MLWSAQKERVEEEAERSYDGEPRKTIKGWGKGQGLPSCTSQLCQCIRHEPSLDVGNDDFCASVSSRQASRTTTLTRAGTQAERCSDQSLLRSLGRSAREPHWNADQRTSYENDLVLELVGVLEQAVLGNLEHFGWVNG